MSKRLVIASLFWFFLAGCNNTLQGGSKPAEASDILTEHRPLKADHPDGKLGDDCTEHGASACLSGLCLHTKPGPRSGYVCSQPCASASDCPSRWTCGAIHPASTQLLCIPPVGRNSGHSSP